jgi:hypothetical protein
LRRFPGSSVEANTAAPILLADGSRDLYFQPDKFREQYAADLPETETKLLALTQRPMAEGAMTEVSNVAAWKAIPSWFIFGTRDNSIPANLLAFMAERAGSKKTVTIEGASHAVMMSHADAVVELVEQAAAAVGDDGVTATPNGGLRHHTLEHLFEALGGRSQHPHVASWHDPDVLPWSLHVGSSGVKRTGCAQPEFFGS